MDSSLHPDVDALDPCERDRQVNRPFGITPDLLAQLMGEQSQLRIILVGAPDDVDREILALYHCGYAVDAWSPPQRIPHTSDVITVYTKRSRRMA